MPLFDKCPGGTGHVGEGLAIECRACLIPSRDDLVQLVDALLVQQGVVLTRGAAREMAQNMRSYFAGRYGLPLETVEEPGCDS